MEHLNAAQVKAFTTPQTFDVSPPDQVAWWSFPVSDVLTRFKTDPTNGLTPEEALARIKQYGPNSLPEEKEPGVWSSLFSAFQDPLALILTLAAVISAAIGLAQGDTQELKQAGLIMGIVIFMTLIGLFHRSFGRQ